MGSVTLGALSATPQQVADFAASSGSDGRSHLDVGYAREQFGGLVVQGALLAERLLSSAITTGVIDPDLRGSTIDIAFRSVVHTGELVTVDVQCDDEAATIVGTVDGNPVIVETVWPMREGSV